MRTVFKSSEIAHVWASQSQDKGRAGNIFFEDKTIYSYGYHFPIAKFINKDTVLVTTRRYSNSTSKHKRIVENAIGNHLKKVYIHKFESVISQIEYYTDEILSLLKKSESARSRKEVYKNEARRLFLELIEYSKIMKDKSGNKDLKKLDGLTNGVIDYEKYIHNQEVMKKRLISIRNKKNAIKKESDLKSWLNGEKIKLIFDYDKIYLRIMGEDVETSWGAIVPLREAKILWDMIQKGKKVIGHEIGYYKVLSIDKESITIGCHKIFFDEIKRVLG